MAILGCKNSSLFIRNFGLAKWLKTRGLAGWLEIATDGLEAPSKRRIAHEIEVHYAEAVNDHITAGESELSAQATALLELGDPQASALNFRKSHLTESEATSMKWMERTAAKPLFSFWTLPLDGIPLAGAALLFSYVNGNPRLLLGSHFLASLVLFSYAGLRLVPRLLYARTPRNTLLRELALCRFTTQAVVLPAIIWLPFLQEHKHNIFGAFDAVFVFYLYGCALNPGFRIWIKIRKTTGLRNDVPSSQMTAS